VSGVEELRALPQRHLVHAERRWPKWLRGEDLLSGWWKSVSKSIARQMLIPMLIADLNLISVHV
jgi:hypothetical protein